MACSGRTSARTLPSRTRPDPRRELARRVSGGMEVTLYWSAHDNSTSVEIWQPETEETLAFEVSGNRALDAFYHPFAHLPTTPLAR
jgi:hypothetical protein